MAAGDGYNQLLFPLAVDLGNPAEDPLGFSFRLEQVLKSLQDLIAGTADVSLVAPADATYLVVSLSAGLTGERRLDFNTTNFTVVDGGAGADLDVTTKQNIHTGASPTFVALALTAAINQLILDSDAANTGTLTMAVLSAARVWTLPNQTGTIALLADIVGFVNTAGTPADNQVAAFTDADTIEGHTGLTYDSAAQKLFVGGEVEVDGALNHDGSTAGFFGTAPTTKQTALTTQSTAITHTAPGTPDFAIQDLTSTGPFGFVTKDEGNTVLQVIANLQTRVQELETKLQAYGLLA